MAILTTIITSSPFDICSVNQASDDIGVQPQYIYVLIRQGKLDVTYPFPSGFDRNIPGQKFVVKNSKYETFLKHWKEVHLNNPTYNKKKKRKKRKTN